MGSTIMTRWAVTVPKLAAGGLDTAHAPAGTSAPPAKASPSIIIRMRLSAMAVLPRSAIPVGLGRAGRRHRADMGGHLAPHAGPVLEMPVMALFRAPIFEPDRIISAGDLLHHVLEVIDAEVEEEVVLLAGEHVELARELRSQRRTVAARILGLVPAILA